MKPYLITLVALMFVTLALATGPVDAACTTCGANGECKSTEDTAFCECTEIHQANRPPRCRVAGAICLVTTDTCGTSAEPDDSAGPAVVRERDRIEIDPQALHHLIRHHPAIGHVLELAKVDHDSPTLLAIETGWFAGVIAADTPGGEPFTFEVHIDADRNGGGAFEIIQYPYTEQLTAGGVIDVISGSFAPLGHQGSAVIDGQSVRWDLQEQ